MARTFPFSIRQVAKILDLNIRYDNPNNGNMDVDCPFCKKESKMNLSASKNVYSCNVCHERGGMVELYGKINTVSTKEAYKEICEILGCSKVAKASDCDTTPKQTSRADSDTIHQTYSMLLSMLNLANPHKEHLSSRGLSDKRIVELNYKSTPAFGNEGICAALLKSGCTLEGVPGFFRTGDEWNLKLKAPGILIPVCSMDGKIAGIQIRLNDPINKRKYIWLSSPDMEGGASSGSPIHFVGDPTAKRIYVTDGTLKGTIANAITHYTFVCISGIQNLSGLDDLLLSLRANGTIEAMEAFNINKLTDEKASKSAEKLRQKLYGFGFKVASAVWEDTTLGSVDEYFLHRRMKASRNHATATV